MDLWIVRKRQGQLFGTERLPLYGLEELFEADLAREGTELRMIIEPVGEEIALRGIELPPLSKLRKTGRYRAIAESVHAAVSGLEKRLRADGNDPELKPADTASALGSIAVLDALLRTKRPLAAVIVA